MFDYLCDIVRLQDRATPAVESRDVPRGAIGKGASFRPATEGRS